MVIDSFDQFFMNHFDIKKERKAGTMETGEKLDIKNGLGGIQELKCFSRLWITAMIFALIGSLISCEDKEEISRKAAFNRAQFKAAADCSVAGGIVITDKDGNMVNCVFKPPGSPNLPGPPRDLKGH